MHKIALALDTARAHGLVNEVVFSALLYMKRYPNSTPLDAITHGMLTWIK
jgi:hypothetical protein